MYGSDKVPDDSERTAFRRAEKQYKLYYQFNSKKKKLPKHVDLSDVLDFRNIRESSNNNGELPLGIVPLSAGFGCPVFRLETRPGFYFIPGALNVEEQCGWIKESLISFPQPSNRTNHNAFYGPIHDLFSAAKEGKFLECSNDDDDDDAKEWKMVDEESRGKTCKSISTSILLRKLRWSTLGLQFDWSKAGHNFQMLLYIGTTMCLFHIRKYLMHSVNWLKEWHLLQCLTGGIQARSRNS